MSHETQGPIDVPVSDFGQFSVWDQHENDQVHWTDLNSIAVGFSSVKFVGIDSSDPIGSEDYKHVNHKVNDEVDW